MNVGEDSSALPAIATPMDPSVSDIPTIEELLNYYECNFSKDWEFYETIHTFLLFVKDAFDKSPDSVPVSDFCCSLYNVLSNQCTDINAYLNLKLFELYFANFNDKINKQLSVLNVVITRVDNKLTVMRTNTKRRKINKSNIDSCASNIPTNNKFDVLETEDTTTEFPATQPFLATTTEVMDTSNPEAAGSSNNQPNIKSNKCQVFFEITSNWRTMLQNIKELATDVEAALSGTLIKINISSTDSYRIIQQYLDSLNIPFRTMDPRSERPRKFVIRGLPSCTPIADIESAIRDIGLEPLKIAYLTNRKTKQPMPLFMVSLRPSPNIDNLVNIKTINFLRVTFEHFKQTGVSQCYRCQMFGHSSLTCKLSPRCVKCGEGHSTGQCTLKKTDACTKCANCKGNHTANYRGCPMNPQNKEKLAVKILKIPASNPKVDSAKNSEKNKIVEFIPSLPPKTSAWKVPLNTKKVITREENVASTSKSKNRNIETSSNVSETTPHETAPKKFKNSSPPKSTSQSSENSATSSQAAVIIAPPSETPTSEAATSTFADFSSVIKTIKELMSEFNIADIIQLFKAISLVMKETKDPIEKLLAILDKIDKYLNPAPCHV